MSRQLLGQYLQSIGIQRRFCEKIASWVDEHARARPQHLTFCVEGNIGAGKSTWLDMVRSPADIGRRGTHEEGLRHQLIEVVPEPIEAWTNLEGTNLLEEFYRAPDRHAFTFQSYVLNTRIQEELRTRNTLAPLRLMERSVFCDRMVFVKAVHQAKHLDDVMLKVYDSWFNPMLARQPELVPHGFVYLKTSPDTCKRRIRSRQRAEEAGISYDYLSQLSNFHEDWLVTGGRPVLARPPPATSQCAALQSAQHAGSPCDLSGSTLHLQQVDSSAASRGLVVPPLPDVLDGQVVLLDSERLKQSNVPAATRLHLVPALHVDCELDVDLEDPHVKAHRSLMMEEFREWVTAYMEQNEDVLRSLQRQALRESLELHADLAGLDQLPPSTPGANLGSLESLAHLRSQA